MERRVTTAYSFSSTCVLLCVTSAASASRTLSSPYGDACRALTLMAPSVLIWYCSALRPETNTALPAAEMQVSRALPLLDMARSPSRPPHPTVEPSPPRDCQVDC